MSQAFATQDYLAGALTEVAAHGETLPQQGPAARWANWPWLAVTLTFLLHTAFLLLGFWLGGVTDRPQAESLPHFIAVRLNSWPAGEEAVMPETLPAKQFALLAVNTAGQNRASSSLRAESSKENTAANSGGLVREESRLPEPAAGGSALPSSAPAAPAQGSETAANAPQSAQAAVLARPLYAANPPPRYPSLARRLGKEGVVGLEVFVSAAGTVEEIKIASGSGHEMLDTAALAAVRGWRFAPGLRNGQPVGMWVRVPVRFALRE